MSKNKLLVSSLLLLFALTMAVTYRLRITYAGDQTLVFLSYILGRNVMPQGASSSTNVLTIMVDDLDVQSFDALLNSGHLPNIKAYIVDAGVRFDNAYVTNSACCPSRASFFTGRYPHNHGVKSIASRKTGEGELLEQGGWEAFKPHEDESLAVWLQRGGYVNGLVGKYMNEYGVAHNDSPPDDRLQKGWSYWQAIATWPHAMKPGTYKTVQKPGPDQEQAFAYPNYYQTKWIDLKAIEFLESTAESDRPFFLLLTPTAPHTAPGDYQQRDQLHPQWQQRVTRDGCEVAVDNDYVVSGRRIEDGDTFGYTMSEYLAFGHDRCAAGALRSTDYYEYGGADLLGRSIEDDFNNPFDNHIPISNTFGLPGWNRVFTAPSFANFGEKPPELDLLLQANWGPTLSSTIAGIPRLGIHYLRRHHLDRLESMISVDVMVGRVMTKLVEQGRLDDTVVIFTSDNGFMLGEHNLGNKMSPYEEAIRVPLIIRTPGVLPDSRHNLVLNNDLAPTILDYANLLDDDLLAKIDGRSLRPLLDANVGADNWRKRFLVEHWDFHDNWWEFPDYAAVHSGNSVVVKYFDDFDLLSDDNPAQSPTWLYQEVYDLITDPFQIVSDPAHTGDADYERCHLDALAECAGNVCREREDRESCTP